MSASTPTRPSVAPDQDETPAEQRVHHHARLGGREKVPAGALRTLCGLTVRKRPDAARMPCCPMCAEIMGGACGAGR